ncbi:MAG: response regulator/pilus assembly protein [Chloroflexi bacterium]|nr:response regulator/pilus assembly protein [Chloroflexota bacterium]
MDNKKILIIEDEFPMRYLIEYQLKQNGFEVNLARDGSNGIKAAQVNKPDLILLDIMMPDMDGFEVCTRIKRDPITADIPVIFVTASEVLEYKHRAFEVGAADYLTKPFRPDELMEQITAVLHRANPHFDTPLTSEFNTAEETIEVGQIISFFSPKGGVGTTTLTIQLAEATLHHTERPVVLIDLNLPLGGIAPTLRLFPRHDICELLELPIEKITLAIVDQFAQRYRDNMFVIPAPGRLINPNSRIDFERLQTVINILTESGYDLFLDLGSHLDRLTIQALSLSDKTFVITSGEPLSNELHDTFLQTADQLGLDSRRLLSVINEVNGPIQDITLARVPTARIPYTKVQTDTKLWLKEQGLRKLVSLIHTETR